MSGRPLGVTIAAIVLAIGGVTQILTGTEALGISTFGLGAAANAADINGWTAVVSGALTILVSAGLFTLAGWAWTLAVVVMVIRIVADAIVIVTQGAGSTLGMAGISGAVISLLVLWYFMRPNVKTAFGR